MICIGVWQKVQLFILYCHRPTILLWNLLQEAALLLFSNKSLDSGRYFIYDIDNAPLSIPNGARPLRKRMSRTCTGDVAALVRSRMSGSIQATETMPLVLKQ